MENVCNISKIKENKKYVSIFINDDKLKIDHNSFNSLNLSIGKIDNSLYQKIKNLSLKLSIRNYIIKKLNKKDYSSYKLSQLAINKFENKEVVESVIGELKNADIVNDKEFILETIEYLNTQNYGKYYILNYFFKNGIKVDEVDDIEFSYENELKKAEAYIEKIKNKYSSYSQAKKKKKISLNLIKRGFEYEIAYSLSLKLQKDIKKESALLEKDYNKLLKKYSSKYSGPKLTQKIYHGLITKGYYYEDIKDLLRKEH